MLDYQKIGTEFLEQLASDPLNWFALWLLYSKFYGPAVMLDMSDSMGSILKTYSLNGIKSYNLCKPYQAKQT